MRHLCEITTEDTSILVMGDTREATEDRAYAICEFLQPLCQSEVTFSGSKSTYYKLYPQVKKGGVNSTSN